MKPLDFGANGINGSVDQSGRIIALNFYHPEHGYVTLTSAAPFPDNQRYDVAAVRAYRKSLAELEGFGFTFSEDISAHTQPSATEAAVTSRIMFADGREAIIETFVADGCILQTCTAPNLELPRFRGRFSLQRCAYTQITEGGVIPSPPIQSHLVIRRGVLTIENPAIGCVVIAGLSDENADMEVETDSAVEFDFAVQRVDNAVSYVAYSFGLTPAEALFNLVALNTLHFWAFEYNNSSELWGKYGQYLLENHLLIRGLYYSLNMAIPVGDGTCLLTDHMLLPLSWNRDAYYLARALLSWHADMHDIVRRHLIWMFEIAKRVAGAWGRSYLANGMIKDPSFQLDQQVFPLLELAEYVLETNDRATFQRLEGHLYAILDMLFARKADFAPLFPTDETPADDPIALPYHLSSHILFWKTLDKLGRLGVDTGTLKDDIRAAVDRYFITDWNGKRIYAYATDGQGNHHLYHDANDFPTVLAPTWGWCSADDPVWRATMEYAFSPANKDAWFDGHLGSVHTKAAWALGDVQDIIVAQIIGDREQEARAHAALQKAAQPDGALPEAYDPQTGEVVARHWFAWPNAAYACVHLGAFQP